MKILETNNYGKFMISPMNRDVTKTRWLEQSMQRHGWLNAYPLHVRRIENGQFEVIAGHHRLAVAQKLGIPVKYVEEKEEVYIHELEKSTNAWTMKDWLTSHVRTGKEDYFAVMEYHKKTGISISMCISLLGGYAGGGRINNEFKDGKFRVGDMAHAKTVGGIVIFCKAVGIPFARDKMFVSAISKVVWAEGFDPKIFKNKISAHMELMTKQASMKAYIDLLDLVFNRASRTRVPLAFNAEEAARQRAVAQTIPEKFTGTSKQRPNMQVVPKRKQLSR